ncbi:MAG: hypothetical protein HQL19_07055 [Candidatus Omnitrophica bacterium]|nr:hypothetical protein [Candidatus Omnitrophota bacterium]
MMFIATAALAQAPAAQKPAASGAAQPAPVAAPIPKPAIDAADFAYQDHAQRDPFWPLVTSGGAIVNYDSNFAVSEMMLEGIISDGKGRIAIINGAIVEEGKRFGIYMVQKIEANRVILVKDGQTSVLQLKKEE